MSDLLPISATAAERALSNAATRIADVPVPLRTLWQADELKHDLLSWLAWGLSVDDWDGEWPDGYKRAVVKNAVQIHRIKGSVASVREVLATLGFGDIEIIEGLHDLRYDGTGTYNNIYTHGDATAWAKYVIVLKQPMSNDRAEQCRRILARTAPARCELVSLVYTTATHTYNGVIKYNNSFNYGAS